MFPQIALVKYFNRLDLANGTLFSSKTSYFEMRKQMLTHLRHFVCIERLFLTENTHLYIKTILY